MINGIILASWNDSKGLSIQNYAPLGIENLISEEDMIWIFNNHTSNLNNNLINLNLKKYSIFSYYEGPHSFKMVQHQFLIFIFNSGKNDEINKNRLINFAKLILSHYRYNVSSFNLLKWYNFLSRVRPQVF